jgi:adenylate cyclase
MEYFLKGLEKYRMRDFRTARDYFLKSLQINPDDGPAAEFIRRCNLFEKNPPPSNWDGVFEMTTK